ncbi:urease accessory protein UreD [Hymenobacter sp. HDW8]|uniref:urease accessory protein UreD n=1 Tax=Hymenobacter sp. HDW8 TaxID=2714932 RepID=UPI00293C0E47|nr:urease accessory protein UreD [Hymenobacter sp. HDW8]
MRGQSRLVVSLSQQPLKLLNPASPTPTCHVVLSSYGGGLVAGDSLRLHLTGEVHTRLFLSTQASTRVFRSPDGAVAEQHTTGVLGAGALAVVFPDPVVLQAQSRYRQTQDWHLQPDSLLLLLDWFHAGRLEQGERFAFTSLQTELRVHVNQQLVVLDRFSFRPAEHIAPSPAHFADYHTFLSVFLVGSPADSRFAHLGRVLENQKMAGSQQPHFRVDAVECLVSVVRARDNVYVLRAAARSRAALQPLCDALLAALAAEELLGYNPLKRKY